MPIARLIEGPGGTAEDSAEVPGSKEKNKWKTARMCVSFMLTLTWMLKGGLRKPHWGTSRVLCAALSTNGVLAARLHRSQGGISEEFLISAHQDPGSRVTLHHTGGRSISAEVEDGRR